MDLFSLKGLARLDGTRVVSPWLAGLGAGDSGPGGAGARGQARASNQPCAVYTCTVYSQPQALATQICTLLYTNNNNIIIFCKINFFVRFSSLLQWIYRMNVAGYL